MYKNLICLLVFLFSYVCGFTQMPSEYVSIKDKKFVLNNQPFFPVTMNYTVDVLYDENDNCYIAQNHNYSAPWGHNYLTRAELFNEVVQDFSYLKDKGFNSVRICGLGYGVREYINGDGTWTNTPNAVLTALKANAVQELKDFPYEESGVPSYDKSFDVISQVLEAAEIAGIKVQLLIGTKKIYEPTIVESFTNYLSAVATHFKNNTTLYSYDFFNEPQYYAPDLGKDVVCDMVKSWHQAIKQNSPYHLTTIGSGTSLETFGWDPGIMTLDFNSYHLYPSSKDLDHDRVRREIKWISETNRLPWIIGETGYSSPTPEATANEIAAHPELDPIDPFPHLGTQQQQKEYAQYTIKMVRDCGGAGYSWWQFYDVNWTSDPIDIIENPKQWFYGIIDRWGHEKLVADAFIDFDPSINENTCLTPNGYYNLDGYTDHRVRGKVKNQYGIPIKNALVCTASGTSVQTFTDEDGEFILESNSSIVKFKIVARATDSHVFLNPLISGQTYILNEYPVDHSLILNNITTNIGDHRKYKATYIINAYDDFVIDGNGSSGGDCDLYSENFIKLKSGFKARKGSHFKAIIGPIFPECGSLPSEIMANKQPTEVMQDDFQTNSFKIQDDNSSITVSPNPTSDIVNILSDEAIQEVYIYDFLGHLKYKSGNLDAREIHLSNLNLSKGTYVLKLKLADGNTVNKVLVFS